MNDEAKQPTKMDPFVQQARSHPRRVAMLGYLIDKRAEATHEAELAGALALSTPIVRYHLFVLRAAGLVTCLRAGAAENYVAAPHAAT